jgi:hypothetical protein
MDITIFSNDLYSKLIELLDLKGLQLEVANRQRTINGLILLKHYQILKSHMGTLDSELPHSSTTHSLFLEMEILVNGLLGDGEVFKSFGYEDLYEHEFLEFKLWKKFQQDKLQKDISTLEEGFWAIDDDLEKLSIPPTQQNSLNLQSTEAESVITAANAFEELPAFETHPDPNSLCSAEVDTPPITLLSEAAMAGHIAIVQLLLDRGANINRGRHY